MKRFNILLLFLIVCITLSSAQNNVSTLSLNHIEETYIQQGLSVVNDTTISLNYTSPISGLSVSGIATLNHSSNSLVRITLEDEYHTEALVYEVYPLLADSSVITFNNVAFETAILDNVIAKSLHIKIVNATLQLNDIHVSTQAVSTAAFSSRQSQVLEAQSSYVIDKLNDNLEKRNLPWRAGETSISRLTYEEKKGLFGGDVPNLGGFEYYKGGIFVMPDYWENHENITPQPLAMNTNEESTEAPYVKEWDWRNRHGKNWMTSVKDQGYCGSCWAFAAVGTLEAYINLYYNQQLNLDLSEQELVSCAVDNGCSGGNFAYAVEYIKEYGIMDEISFPYREAEINCSYKSSVPSERIIANKGLRLQPFHTVTGINSIKTNLFKYPLCISISKFNHDMVLVGFKTLQEGDVYHIDLNEDYIISEDDPLIGSTVLIMKNSYGDDWGEGGYANILINAQVYLSSFDGAIQSLNYTNDDIEVTDNDNDGYYFRGISNNATGNTTPRYPSENDYDDSNADYALIDIYGNLLRIEPDTIEITGTQISSTFFKTEDFRSFIPYNLVIKSFSTFTFREDFTIYKDVTFIVEDKGTLIIDGCTLEQANIIFKSGSELNLVNNATIILSSEDCLSSEKGSILYLDKGTSIEVKNED